MGLLDRFMNLISDRPIDEGEWEDVEGISYNEAKMVKLFIYFI